MLVRLTIQNFVLIHELNLSFEDGFTAITGETGSGKSILLNALGLIKGDRADFSVIGPAENRCIVEGQFQLQSAQVEWLVAEGFEAWNPCILRREIHKDGRSRAFINDTPVNLSTLRTLAEQLLIIHSQYNTLELKNPVYQLHLLDAFAGTKARFNDFTIDFEAFLQRQQLLAERKQTTLEMEAKMDYERFILTEIQQLNLVETDFQVLEEKLASKEDTELLLNCLSALSGISESASIQQLKDLIRPIEKNAKGLDDGHEIIRIVNEISTQFTELSYYAAKAIQSLEGSQQDAHEEADKLDEFNRILNKHRLNSQEALMDYQLQLEGRIGELNALKVWIKEETEQLIAIETQLIEKANVLYNERSKALPILHKQLENGLNGLKLAGAKIEFHLTKTTSLNAKGMVDLTILFSANKGIEPVPIQKAASGGELSRVMLLLQQLISKSMDMPSILFDEIDTGVSGDVAERIGKLLHEMGKGRQLFAITHLPQVAAKATHHLVVKKLGDKQGIHTTVESINESERINEIARLMSGAIINEGAVINAKKLMGIHEL